jgi:hypothetical protein
MRSPAKFRRDLTELVEAIVERRSKVRDLIRAFRDSSRQPFPAWQETPDAKTMSASNPV